MSHPISLTVITLLLAVSSLSAATHYVSLESTNPTPPYTNWVTAATNIQQAVDAAAVGDDVVVTNGVYPGGVTVTNPLALLSVNGPQFTMVDGYGTNRCGSLAEGASLTGFTLTNGYDGGNGGGVWCSSPNSFLTNCVIAGNSAVPNQGWGGYGGGACGGTLYNCTLNSNSAYVGGGAAECTLRNCTLAGNSARFGGGVSGGTLYNCLLSGNSAGDGGGAFGCTLYNCTLTGNSAYDGNGGGASGVDSEEDWFPCTLYNCIVYFNTGSGGANYGVNSTLNYCCTTPLPTNGVGNIVLDPQLASASHLSANSPCRGAGSADYATGTDIDGEPWTNPPSIGCDEYHPGAVTGPLTVRIVANYTYVTPGYPVAFTALIQGRTTVSVWDFGDGVVVSNRPWTSHAWVSPGEYAVVLRAYNESYPDGVRATVTVHVVEPQVHYVAADSANPLPPYTSWATAATNIQDAVDTAAVTGSLVMVTNGVYASSGRVAYGTPSRLVVDKALTLRTVNGPQFTIINGGGTNRCAYLTDGASLTGFTLTNGYAGHGGGVWCASTNVFLTNCVIAGNSAIKGGGAFRGTLYDCTLTSNSVSGIYRATQEWPSTVLYFGSGGAASGSKLHHCTISGNSGILTYGGGASDSTLFDCALSGNSIVGGAGGAVDGCALYDCTLSGNSSGPEWFGRWGNGGGASRSTLYNCALSGNSAGYGGGATSCTLYNCTLTGNSVQGPSLTCMVMVPFGSGGGADGSTLYNCTLTGNSALANTNGAGGYGGGAYGGNLYNCVVYHNDAPNGANYFTGVTDFGLQVSTLLQYSCTTPQPTNGVGNIDADPLFVDFAGGNLRLRPDSPCINAGNNAYATNSVTDLDGNARISGGVVDMGAYEFVFTPSMEVAQLILLVNDSDLGAKNRQPLLATLSAALASFERGNLNAGANQLQAFQNKVRAQVARMDAALANDLNEAAQQIIEEVTNH